MSRQLLSKQETGKKVKLHPESVMRLAREGRFPKPIKTGSAANCRVRFIAEEVDAWVAARMAERPRIVPEIERGGDAA